MIGEERLTIEETLLSLGRAEEAVGSPELISSPLLAALQRAGTSHVYADTADVDELAELLAVGENRILAEVDGNTANQPLVRKVVAGYLDKDDAKEWARRLRSLGVAESDLWPLMYAIVCGRVGSEFARAFASGRPWEVSLQLHMGLCSDPEAAKQVGRYTNKIVPTALVKVPFTPNYPHCFFLARDLERLGEAREILNRRVAAAGRPAADDVHEDVVAILDTARCLVALVADGEVPVHTVELIRIGVDHTSRLGDPLAHIVEVILTARGLDHLP
jgi:hypothetical protein